MRTLILIVIGVVLAWLTTHLTPPARRMLAASAFTLGWLLVVGWNLRTGLSHGYSLREELPIQSLIFLLPTVLAWWLALRATAGR